MRSLYLACTFGLVAALGCGGGGSNGTTTPDPLDPGSRENSVAIAGDIAVADMSADAAFVPALSSFEFRQDGRMDADDESCRTRQGDPDDDGGMTITFDDCETPRGTLNGTINFQFDRETRTRTSTRDLTFTRLDGSTVEIDGTATWTHTMDH
ncbi:MAG TPA: hypothetical protein VEI97_15225, partial [bacterium]|nr:hypothetical protein [bacterium]